MKTVQGYRNKRWRWFIFIAVLALFNWQGCSSSEEDGIPIQYIVVNEPPPGQTVQTHSLHYAVTLHQDVNPAGLRVFLNGQDMSSHLRITGASAEGYVSGMTPGTNVLRFTAPGPQGGTLLSLRVTWMAAPLQVVVESA